MQSFYLFIQTIFKDSIIILSLINKIIIYFLYLLTFNKNFFFNFLKNLIFSKKLKKTNFLFNTITTIYLNNQLVKLNLNFDFIQLIFIKFLLNFLYFSNFIDLSENYKNNRQINTNFFKKKKNLMLLKYYSTINFTGLKQLLKLFKNWFLPLILLTISVFHGLIIHALPFNKVIFIWIAFFMVLYWLLSGFVFFFKKYQFGKYTSAIQRFWRRSYILFWLLESCLLFVFIYLTFIASQESFYMYDQIQIYKTHLFSWKIFLLKIVPLLFLLLIVYFLMLSIKWNFFSKLSIWILFITVILTYIAWIEFYQFFHIVNFYGNLNWLYDVEEKIWSLELESRRTRIVNHYVMLLLILKFWHLLFVYGFWLFYILRSNEKHSLKYPLLAANFQNFIILYIMSWLYMYPWLKIYLKKLLISPYYWFYVNNRSLTWRIFFLDLKLFFSNLLNHELFTSINAISFYKNIPFFYWIESDSVLFYYHTRKHFIKNTFLLKLYDLSN